MAIFGNKKNKKALGSEVKTETSKRVIASNKASTSSSERASVLLSPRFTEKSALRAEGGVYCFNVASRADKRDIAFAFTSRYNLVPRKINIVRVMAKRVFVRGKAGRTASSKKAYVYLKKGETIEFV